MSHSIHAIRAAASFFVIWSLAALPAAAERPEPPPFYAIRDARVVTGTGESLERATVLIADGLIEAVGADIEIPADAWVIDGEGLVLYPGLIDAMTDLGQKREESASPRGRGRPGAGPPPPRIRGPEDRPATQPWRSAADLLADDGRVEQWRDAGFTAAVTVPGGGFFPGQATLIHLGDAEPGARVLATPIAQRLGFRGNGGFRDFPGSLMGGIAYVRQVFFDAEHYGKAEALYRKSPSGRKRNTYDRTLAPIHAAVEDGLPFLIPAARVHEIDRVLGLASEWRIEPVIVGGHGAYARAEELRAGSASVLLDLKWPEADKDADPDADTPLPELYHRRMAPVTPKLLHEAAVPFAFTSGGLSGPPAIFEGVRAAIDAGLTHDAAVHALTLGAARIFGAADRLGSIEAGKIANLVLATAEPWAEEVEIRAVFIDGRKYQQPQEDEEDQEPPASDVSGTWALELQAPSGVRELTAELTMSEDGRVSGEVNSERGTRTVEKGRMSGDQLTFKTTQTMGERSFTATYSLAVAEDAMTGSLSTARGAMDLTGERTAAATGGDDDDEPAVSLEELEAAMALYHGPVRELDAFAITGATVYTAGEVLEDATVVVEGGKISAIGSAAAGDVDVPRGAEVIDAAGGSLIPGIIDAHSHIAGEGGLNEGTVAVSSMVTIRDVVDPRDIAIYRALAGGVTTINVLHGSSNPIGGGNAVLKLRWGQDAGGLLLDGAPPGIKFALGENPKRSRRDPPPGVERRYPATRMGVMDVIRQAFTEAREYQKRWQEHEQNGNGSMPPRRDLKLEPLVEILDGERLIHAHSYRADEILQLMRLAEELGFRVATLQHVLEGYKIADEIAAHGAGASTFSDWWGYKVEAYDAIPHNAALMTERGVLVSINSDSAEEMRHLNQEAAKAIKWGGMDRNEALKLVTLNPAKQLGIDDRVGSIEVGKDADLVLYDGDPLSMFSVVQKTFVDGDLYFDREADRVRQAALDAIKEKVKLDDDKEDEEPGVSPPPPEPEYLTYTCREVH